MKAVLFFLFLLFVVVSPALTRLSGIQSCSTDIYKRMNTRVRSVARWTSWQHLPPWKKTSVCSLGIHVSVLFWFCSSLTIGVFVSLCFSFPAHLPPTGVFYLFIFTLTHHMKLHYSRKNPSLVVWFRTFALDQNKRIPERSGGCSLSTH